MSQQPDGLAGSDTETTAELLRGSFDAAARVAAQVTPQDTERALARILRRVQTASSAETNRPSDDVAAASHSQQGVQSAARTTHQWKRRGPRDERVPRVSIRVVVAQGHALVRAAIVMFLNAEPDIIVVAEAANGRQAIELAREYQPDVVLMDVRMPDLDGISATRILTQETSQNDDHLTKVIILTMLGDDDVYGALQAGASGVLLKHAPPHDLVAATRRSLGR